jgi:hypothetical protein
MRIAAPRLSWKSIRPLARANGFTLTRIGGNLYAAYPSGTSPDHPRAAICDYPKTMAGILINRLSRRA